MPGRRNPSSRDPRGARSGRSGSSRRPAREERGLLETLVMAPSGKRGRAESAAPSGGRLVDACAEWLGLVLALRGVAALPDPAGLRARALDLKGRLEQTARERSFQTADVEAALFALVAFLDETVLNAPGAAREVWLSRPLQLELYQLNIAGEQFFDRLEALRRDREARIEALEVYYACLALGFAGRYRMAAPERLQQLIAEVERDIAAVRRTGAGPLSPRTQRGEEFADVVAEGVPAWLSLVVFIPGIILAWLLISLLAHHGAGRAADAIRALSSR